MDALILLLEGIDWGPDTIDTLLGLVPERYRANVEAIMALMAALSMFLATVRPVMAKYAPRLSGSAPVVMLDRLLHAFAGNSKPLEVRAPVVRESTRPPPPDPEP